MPGFDERPKEPREIAGSGPREEPVKPRPLSGLQKRIYALMRQSSAPLADEVLEAYRTRKPILPERDAESRLHADGAKLTKKSIREMVDQDAAKVYFALGGWRALLAYAFAQPSKFFDTVWSKFIPREQRLELTKGQKGIKDFDDDIWDELEAAATGADIDMATVPDDEVGEHPGAAEADPESG
jgi:hypothetical protein